MMIHKEQQERHFLMLQGLMGPFFCYLGEGLISRGYKVWKVNFNWGDEVFWGLPHSIPYRMEEKNWKDFLYKIINKYNITDVILFGDCRSQHYTAIKLCKNLNIPVHVFEEGYLRPDWVTLEVGGVNAHSSLPKDPQWFRDQAKILPPPPEHDRVSSSFKRRAWEGIIYNTAMIFGKWRYPYDFNHRPWPPLIEAYGWAKRLLRRKKEQEKSKKRWQSLKNSKNDFMLFPLQLDADAQIRLHSRFKNLTQVIKEVIMSFGQFAPDYLHLVVKEHPLDNGVINWKNIIKKEAQKYGVENRIKYLEYGDIEEIVKCAKGIVTVNSTTGTFALASRVPVITLGHAVYNMKDITFQGTLDEFWNKPKKPDSETFNAFRRVLIDRCLISGGFFSEYGLTKLVISALERIENHDQDK